MTTLYSLQLSSSNDLVDPENQRSIISSLDAWSSKIARDLECRVNIETNISSGLWDPLEILWKATTELCIDQERHAQNDLNLVTSVARFTRNLVAGVGNHQIEAYKRTEPYIRKLVHYFTSFLQMQRAEVLPVTRILAQALSNIITDNNETASLLWADYMATSHDGNILLRLLTSEDIKVIMTSFILMLNSIKGSVDRCALFVDSKAGQRVAIKVLTHVSNFIDEPESTVEATVCDIGYQFLKQSFDYGLAVRLYDNIEQAGEPIMAYQRTLLKLLDGYFQASGVTFHTTYSQSIPRLYSSLLSKASHSVESSLSQESSSASPDLNLPALAEGLALTAQCVQALLLHELETGSMLAREAIAQMERKEMERKGCIELTVHTLRNLDILVPRIQFGKAIPSPLAKELRHEDNGPDPTSFPFVKRDLIRLLGTLAFRNKVIQDRIRQCGGIEVILNHCTVDEQNPYMREHAIFTLRNLLEDNEQNQEVVRGIRPPRDFDSDGVLKDLGPIR